MTKNLSFDPKKIIQLADYLKTGTALVPWAQDGIDALNSLPSEAMTAAIEFLLNYVFLEVRMGLGIADIPEDASEPDMENLKIFQKIDDIYEEAAGNCYFCSGSVDPNEDEFGPDVNLCFMCRLKLGNFTEALGVPAGSVFKGMDRRFIQKTRIKRGN